MNTSYKLHGFSLFPVNKTVCALLVSAGILFIPHAILAAEHDQSHQKMDMSDGKTMDHSQHMKMMQSKGQYQLSRASYSMPDTRLIDVDGKPTSLHEVLDYPDGVMMNFIFTSCTTICPTMSAIFSGVDRKLATSKKPMRLISISIDPEYDTPGRLRAYAAKFHADRNWQFFTGDRDAIIDLQKKLNVYRGNKMNHFPVTFVRHAGVSDWLRIDGFTIATDLIKEYDKLAARKASD